MTDKKCECDELFSRNKITEKLFHKCKKRPLLKQTLMELHGINFSHMTFPERLFVIGAGPSLEILHEHRHEANGWGDWAVITPRLVQPLLASIEPKYTIKGNPSILSKHIEQRYDHMNPHTGGGISTIHSFVYNFQENGGKELFLFGFDGDSSGYWRQKEAGERPLHYTITKDCDYMNECSSLISIDLFHIGGTRHKTMKQISITEMIAYLNIGKV